MSVDLKIKVTKEILEKSKMCGYSGNTLAKNAKNCAIALAVRDIFPNAYVGGYEISTTGKQILFIGQGDIRLPSSATEFIRMFDRALTIDRPLLPEIEFTISIPDEVIQQIDIEAIRPMLINHPTLELV